jgi:hypothetical protein
MTSCPAMFSVADRLDRLPLREMLKVTVPLPVPAAPAEIVTHDTGLDDVHAQPPEAVTLREVEVADEETATLAGDTAYVHAGGGAAACCTVKFHPAARIVVVRGDVSVLGATLNETVPGPVVDAPAVTVTQAA